MAPKSARWIRHTHLFRGDDYTCSACGASAGRPYSACPRCGASMGGSKYDPSWVDDMETLDAIFDD